MLKSRSSIWKRRTLSSRRCISGFSSADLDQNQITDYLTRVVQPKLSAISGVQRADILGDRTFAMRLWLKPQEMAARGVSPSDVHDALAKNNYLSALGAPRVRWFR
jgi:multidrug efflux pump